MYDIRKIFIHKCIYYLLSLLFNLIIIIKKIEKIKFYELLYQNCELISKPN